MRLLRKLRRFAASVTVVLLGAGGLGAAAAVVSTPALAATGCSAVAYTVPSQWNTGFTANINMTNLGTTRSPAGTSAQLRRQPDPAERLERHLDPDRRQRHRHQRLLEREPAPPARTVTGIGANFNYSGTHTPASTVTCTPTAAAAPGTPSR